MSLINKLKYAFGLDTSNDLEDDADFNALPDASVGAHKPASTEHVAPKAEPATVNDPANDHAEVASEANDDVAIDAIFEHVVTTFNIALPDFLRKSVDPVAQRKYLYNTLTSDLQHFLKGLAANAESKYRKYWNEERDKLNAKLREAERLAADYSQKNNELRQNLLSADRQKRALSTRSAELEKKIYELEADREQRELESKSMVNKVKAVQVYEKDIEAMRAEIAALNKQLEEARKVQDAPAVTGTAEPAEPIAQEPPKQRPEDAQMIENLRVQLEEASLKIADLTKEREELRKKKEAEKKEEIIEKKEEIKTTHQENKPEDVSAAGADKARAKAPAPGKTRQQPRDERMDDILGDTEWIVAPTPSKRKRDGERRHDLNKDDDRQMSLF